MKGFRTVTSGTEEGDQGLVCRCPTSFEEGVEGDHSVEAVSSGCREGVDGEDGNEEVDRLEALADVGGDGESMAAWRHCRPRCPPAFPHHVIKSLRPGKQGEPWRCESTNLAVPTGARQEWGGSRRLWSPS